ncbi:putative membrane protein [Halalkaliarchaeum sp. AArc-CO]|uniref:DUF7546 family protein n=1 Tax=Halalkaliarchaeum sp. AArc-GB TaxID=3074078 RepID=UPI00285F1B39|nr:hypothetical protein [Halalkaliarchaeum sp. AArc-GB]MDR5672360.1 hypothetical protein [Halalkaliarchaeum sp. AArc-GB]UWG50018.1 putative membrane protein [Halalkaliarchaeum sp. AArc-CO]
MDTGGRSANSHGRFGAVTGRIGELFSRSDLRRDVMVIGGLLAIQLAFVAVYFLATDAEATQPRYLLYPLAWVAVGLWAPFRVGPKTGSTRARIVGAAVAVGYFLLVVWIAGLIGTHGDHAHHVQTGLDVALASPGWGPRVSYVTAVGHVTVIPYLVVGYATLSYLVYAAIADATSAAASGVLGLFACVGCSFSLLASVVAGAAGGSSGLATAVYSLSIDLSTLVFLFAVGLLLWRPGFRD